MCSSDLSVSFRMANQLLAFYDLFRNFFVSRENDLDSFLAQIRKEFYCGRDAVGVGDGKVWTDQKTCAGGDGWVCGVKASRWIGRKKESHLLWTRLLVLTSNAGFRQGADRLLE